MKIMLQEEGVRFVGDYEVDMKRHFWKPRVSTATDEMDDFEHIP